MKFLRTTVLTISLLAFLSVPALAQTKIGTVDLRKLFDGYWKTKQAQAALTDRQAQLGKDIKSMSDELKKGGEEYQKLLEQANDQAISADQRDKRKQAAADKLKQLQDSKTAIDQFERQAQVTLREQQADARQHSRRNQSRGVRQSQGRRLLAGHRRCGGNCQCHHRGGL